MNKLLVAIVVGLIVSCNSQSPQNDTNIALVEKYVQAVEQLDYNAMDNLLSEDYLGVGPSYGDSTNKETAVDDWKYNVENLYEKISYAKSRNIAVTIHSGPNQGEWVSNWAELEIKYRNDDQRIRLFANTLYKIENEKIVQTFTIYNEADALRQLGFTFVNFNQ